MNRWQRFELLSNGANNAPKKPGVYVLYAEGVLVYVGEAHGNTSSVHARLKKGAGLPDWDRHRAHKHFQIWPHYPSLKKMTGKCLPLPTERWINWLEKKLIWRFRYRLPFNERKIDRCGSRKTTMEMGVGRANRERLERIMTRAGDSNEAERLLPKRSRQRRRRTFTFTEFFRLTGLTVNPCTRRRQRARLREAGDSPGPVYMPRSVSLVGLARRGVFPQNNSTRDYYFVTQ
jgi:hypothetical protein